MKINDIETLYKMAAAKFPMIVGSVDARGKLTFYSLYKQINEGDADVPGNKELHDPIKL